MCVVIQVWSGRNANLLHNEVIPCVAYPLKIQVPDYSIQLTRPYTASQ